VNYAKELDRRDLILAIWAAEFTRTIGGLGGLGGRSPLVNDVMHLRRCAELAAASADRAVEALRLLVDVEFTPPDANDDCHLTWDDFITSCRATAFTDDDGHGALATADRVSNIRVCPSDAMSERFVRPDWATHVYWYNK
jgi:hypothetical protein